MTTKRIAITLAAVCTVALWSIASRALDRPEWEKITYIKEKGELVLTWKEVAGAESYRVFRSNYKDKHYREIAQVTQTTYRDSDLQAGKTYYYAVETVSGTVASPRSTTRTVRMPSFFPASALSSPKWKWIKASWRRSPAEKGYHVYLFWENVKRAAVYNVYRSEKKAEGYTLIASIPDPEARYIDTNVQPGKTHFYKVTALTGGFEETPLESAAVESITLPPEGEKLADDRQYGGRDSGDWFRHNRVPFGGGWNTPRDPHTAMGINQGDLQHCTSCHQRLQSVPKTGAVIAGEDDEEGWSERLGRESPAAQAPPPSFYMAGKRPAKARRAFKKSISRGGTAAEPSYAGFGEVFDEVWVIQKTEKKFDPEQMKDMPGSGELRAVMPDKKQVPVPLEHTAVTAEVTGYIARVLVKQAYRNPYDTKIEAVYVFPLPQNAAVSEFVMQIGERRIRGIIREREEAKRVYEAARRQGYVASLLTQERPNIFTQKVANIEPGKAIDIEVTYFNTLAYSEGEYTFVFPMVVGPRYNPPGFTEGVGAVGRGSAGASGQKTEVQYLRPEERSGHDIMVTVNVDAGVGIEKVYSNSHAVRIEKGGKSRATVSLSPADTIPNKDFVLRYRVAGKGIKSALMTDRDEQGGYFTLMLQPPGNLEDLPRSGQEMVFVLDTSGSMSGWPMAKSKAAMRHALKKLRPTDTFQIVRFSGNATSFSPSPVPATTENIEAGLTFLEGLRGGGGTQMIEGIKAALDFPHDESRLRVVSFLTDGYIGNETQIFAAVAEKLGPARIFSFGIGNSVNRYLIEGLARLGRGAVAYVLTGDSNTEAVDLFYDRIRHPALTDISIDWGGMEVSDVYPKIIPDLFVGRPVIVTGRFKGRGETTVRVRGKTAGERQSIGIDVALDDPAARHSGISRVWARARIAELSDAMAKGEGDRSGLIRETALAYSLMSSYTAFVAVDSSRRTDGDYGTTVNVPVPVPEGVRYETTVQE